MTPQEKREIEETIKSSQEDYQEEMEWLERGGDGRNKLPNQLESTEDARR